MSKKCKRPMPATELEMSGRGSHIYLKLKGPDGAAMEMKITPLEALGISNTLRENIRSRLDAMH